MIKNTLVNRSQATIKLGEYAVATSAALSDVSLLPRVQEYRRLSGSRMAALDRDDILKKIPAADFHVSRKVDGEFTVLVFRNGEFFALNPGGTVRMGLPWQEEAAKLLSDAGVTEAMVAGELYVETEDRRPRVHDVAAVARQPESDADIQRLRFAVFDLMSIDNETPSECFSDTWIQIEQIFGKGELVHPVEAKMVKDAEGIDRLFEEWVENDGAEGLVARSDDAGLFKIKPRHTLDLAVIGFTESTDDRQGLIHDLLLAVMRGDGTLQVVTRVGGGFSTEQRREMLSDLKDMVVDSEYAEVNSDHVAYQMVRPDWVVEVSCLDLISQTTRGGPVNRMVLEYADNGSQMYNVVRRLPLAAVISPQFVRRREDKSVLRDDVRIGQVSDVVEVPLTDSNARQLTLPESEILRREVYTKEAKGETMVRKFVLIKTNKESESDEYPAYVVHYTDFSPNRKTPLAREVRVSKSREQIVELYEGLKTANIKKGWQMHSASGDLEAESVEPPEPVSEGAEAEAVTKPTKKKLAPSKRTKTTRKSTKKTG